MTCCQRCGAELPPGTLKYIVTIHVTADFDGVLPAEGSVEDLEAFMIQVDSEDSVQLEKDVYQSKGYLLCPACKASFLQDPLRRKEAEQGEEDGGRVH